MIKTLLVLLVVALIVSMIGFYKYVYFISLGYGFAISAQAIAMLFFFSGNLTPAIIVTCGILTFYGFRLSGFLLVRELKSNSYRSHMDKEIKDGSTVSFGYKLLIWISCALLYLFMITPALFRFMNGDTDFDVSFIIGTVITVLGLITESASDILKNKLKKKNPKRFCSEGLFKIVRCPNYFGELLIWTGILIIGVTSFTGIIQWTFAILGYIGIVFVMFSGARRLEIRQNKNYGNDPEYQNYVKTVPIILPFVPLYSVEKYKFLIL